MFEGPCTNCEYKTECAVYDVLRKTLYNRRSFQRGDILDDLDLQMDLIGRSWVRTVSLSRKTWPAEDTIASLPALFDLLCSALYAREALSLDGGPRQTPGLLCKDELIFPYTWMCPRCVSRGYSKSECYLPGAKRETANGNTKDYPNVEYLAKPRSRFIGDVGIKVLRSILRVMLEVSPHPFRISEGGGRRGDFDLTIASDEILVLGEVKAKPLIAFPLILRNYDSAHEDIRHEWVHNYSLEGTKPALHIAASNLFVNLELPTTPLWPLDVLVRKAQDESLVQRVVSGWRKHLDAYRRWKAEPDKLRWHRFGCGNFADYEGTQRIERRVANTKELPGLDRTDDIKKGTSQVLLFSRFKLGCHVEALKSALLGNLYAETHGKDYLDHLAIMQVRTPEFDRFEWIFDMILGLSRNVFHSTLLKETFQTENFFGNLNKS